MNDVKYDVEISLVLKTGTLNIGEHFWKKMVNTVSETPSFETFNTDRRLHQVVRKL